MWRFYLDGTLQATEELNWEGITFGIKRYEEFNALFFEYTSGLEFSGASYTYLKGVIDSGSCDRVHLRVQYRCNDVSGSFLDVFDGFIYLSDAELDLFNCQLSCEAEDNSFSGRLIALKDKKIPLDSTKSEDGTTITACPTTTISVQHPTTGGGVPRIGYKVFDVFQFLMRYITNNQSTITSSLFSTVAQREQQVITFTDTTQLTGSGNIVITLVNPFNQTLTVTSPKQGTVLGTLRRILYDLHNTALSNPQQEYYANSWIRPNDCSTNGTNTIVINWNQSFEIVSVSGAPTSFATSQAETIGASNLCLFSGLNLRGVTTGGVPSISFMEIWEEINKIFNMGFTLTNNGGVADMSIELIENIFNTSTNTIELLDIPEMKRKRSVRFAKDTINVGDGGKKQGFLSAINKQDTWAAVSVSCKGDNTQDCKNEWIVDHDRIFFQRTTTEDDYDEEIFLLETNGSTTKFYNERAYTNTSGANIIAFIYNATLCNFYKVKNWLFSSASDMQNGGMTIVKETIPSLRDEYSFKSPIGIDEFIAFKNNPENYFKFSPTLNLQDGNIGWIEEAEFGAKTSETEFKLLTP